jgi:hypothetical protein
MGSGLRFCDFHLRFSFNVFKPDYGASRILAIRQRHRQRIAGLTPMLLFTKTL